MADQNETQNNDQGATGGAPAPTTSAPVAAEIPQDVLKELETLRAHKAALEDDLKKNRDKRNKALEEQGQYKELVAAREQERDEFRAQLEQLKPLASVKEEFDGLVKDLRKMVKERLALLPEGDTVGELIAELDSPMKQLRHLDRHLASLGSNKKTRTSEPTPDGSTPAEAQSAALTSIAGLSGSALEEAINRNREALNERAAAFAGGKPSAFRKYFPGGGN